MENNKALLDCLCESIFVIDYKGSVLYINKQGRKRMPFINEGEKDLFKKVFSLDTHDVNDVKRYLEKERIIEVDVGHGEQILKTKAKIIDGDFDEKKCYYLIIDEGLFSKFPEEALYKDLCKEKAKSYGKLEMLYESLGKDKKDLDSKNYLEGICTDIKFYLDASYIMVFYYDEENNNLINRASVGFGKDLNDKIHPMSFVDRNINEEEILNFIHPDNEYLKYEGDLENKCKKYVIDSQEKYVVNYPIMNRSKVLGVLSIGYNDKELNNVYPYTFVQSICNEISVIIENEIMISDLKKKLSTRINIEEELKVFFYMATDFMCILGKDGYLRRVNAQFTKVLGWTENELLSTPFVEFIHKEDREGTLLILENKRKGPDNISRMMCKDGSYRLLSWQSKYINDRDIIIGTARDITNYTIMEEKNKILEKNIEMEFVKNEFFTNISHEFKTPLNIIIASMQLMKKHIDDNNIIWNEKVDLKKYMNSIKQNSYRLLRLSNNIIDMTKIDSGYYEVNLVNCNIVNVIEDVTMSVVQYTEAKNITLTFDTDEEEVYMACDRDKVERIMLNLLSNSVKYTDEGGSIFVKVTKEMENYITISVKDNGIGMKKEDIAIIFDRFTQLNSGLRRKCEGTGIGLSLVKSLVEMHGGNIGVESTEGEGSEFIFNLPIKVVEENENMNLDRNSAGVQIEKCNIEFSHV